MAKATQVIKTKVRKGTALPAVAAKVNGKNAKVKTTIKAKVHRKK